MLDVLTRFKAADVEKAVNALGTEQIDTLMKYVYRGFAYPTENSCGILLVWHEKVGGLYLEKNELVMDFFPFLFFPSGGGSWWGGFNCEGDDR